MVDILTNERTGTAQALAEVERSDAEVVRILREEREEMIQSKSSHSRKWPDFGRLYRGDHWRQAAIGGDSHVVWNKFAGIIRARTALVTQGRVRFQALANVPDPNMVCRAIDARLEDIQERNRVAAVQSQMLVDHGVIGTACDYVWYDPDARDGRGDHKIEWLDPYNLFVDAYATSAANVQLFAIRKIYSKAQADALWPEHKGEFKSERLTSTSGQIGLYRPEEDLPNFGGWGGNTITGTDDTGNAFLMTSRNAVARDRGRHEQNEVHVWEHYVRSTWADAVIDPAILAAQGRSAEKDARAEHSDLVRGQFIKPQPLQDHGAHLKSHRQFVRANRDRISAEQTAAMAVHMQMHEEALRSPEIRRLRASRYPGGWRLILTAGELVLYDGPTATGSPYLPVSVFRNYDDNGRFWGISDAVDAEGLSHAIDVGMSQIVDIMRVKAHRPRMLRSNSGITKEQLVGEVGTIIVWDGDPKDPPPVQWSDDLQLDPSMQNAVSMLKSAMEDAAGFSGSVEGNAPFAGASGDAIQLLQNASSTRIAKISDDFANCWTDTGYAALSQVVTHDLDPMVLKVLADPNRLPMGAMPTGEGDGKYFVPINHTGMGPMGEPISLNRINGARIDDIGIVVNASGTPARGKVARRNELVGLGREGIIDKQVVREGMVELGVLSPQQLQRQMQIQQQQAPQAPPPRVNVNIRGDIPPQQAMQIAGGQPPGASPETPPGVHPGMAPGQPPTQQPPQPPAPEAAGLPPVEEAFGNFDKQGNHEQQMRG